MFLGDLEIFKRVSSCKCCRPEHKTLTEAAARGESLVPSKNIVSKDLFSCDVYSVNRVQ